MSLFLKHILRTLRRSPTQPFLILLTVILSTALAITAFRLPDMFREHIALTYGGEQELGDVTVEMRGDSNTRILFAEDAERVLGEDGRVLGEFRLTGLCTDAERAHTILSISAVDLLKADDFYQFEYIQYGRFTAQSLDTSVVLSQSMAESLGVGIGDTLALQVLGEERLYTVQAIARDQGLLRTCDLLIPIDGIRHSLALRVPAIGSLGDAFAPCTRLMIELEGNTDREEILQRLSEDAAFSDKLVESTDSGAKIRTLELMQTVSLWIPALLLLILTALLIATAFKLLRQQRSDEYALFRTVGATEQQMTQLQLTEGVIYALLGTVGGILLSFPLLQYTSTLYLWQTTAVSPEIGGILFGVIWAPLLTLGSLMLHIRGVRRSEQKSGTTDGKSTDATDTRGLLFPLLLLLFALTACLFTPTKWRYLPAIAAFLFLVWLAYLATPRLLIAIARFVTRRLDKRTHPNPHLLLTLKSLLGSAALRQVGRLSVLLLSLLLTISVCTATLQKQSDHITGLIRGELIVAGANETIGEELSHVTGVENTSLFSYLSNVELPSGKSVVGISFEGEANNCFDTALLPKQAPHGDRVAVSVGIAALEGVGVGDRLTLSVKGCSGSFTVSEIVDTHAYFVYFDVTVLGMKNDLLCVDVNTDTEALPLLRERVAAATEINGASVLLGESLLEELMQTLMGYVAILKHAVWAAVIVAVAGIVNLLAEQHRARRKEREILSSCGMTKASLLGMHACELCVLLLLSALIAFPLGGTMCLLVDYGVRSFGLVLFL